MNLTAYWRVWVNLKTNQKKLSNPKKQEQYL